VKRWRRGAPAIACVALVAALAACGSNNNANKGANNGAPGGAGAQTAGTAAARPGSAGRTFKNAPAFTIDKNKGYIATIKTKKGDIVVQLNAQAAPLTVNNFVFLARQHFYDGLTCHRVIPDFVAQCGDPQGDGGGGPGYTIPDEPGPLKHDTGVIAMAKASTPNSAGSQFYITLAPQPALDGGYTVFGQVISGMDAVRGLTPRDPSVNPNAPPGDVISAITIAETDTTPTPAAAPAGNPAPAASPRPTP